MSHDGDLVHPDPTLPEGEEAPPRGVRVMAVVRWALVALMALAALAALEHRYRWLGAAADRGDGHEEETIYYCPMHPGMQQDHPGECPICHMTLVPREARDHAGHAAPGADATDAGVPGMAVVTLTPERVQLLGMRTARVGREALAPELRTVGVVAASETALAVIHTRFAGWIESLAVEQTGQRVRKGQVLATIYSPELLTAQQEYLSALRWAKAPQGGGSDLSAGLAHDARRRLELLGISAAELDEIAKSGEPMRAIPVRAPSGGHVVDKGAVKGLYVQPGTPLFRVADLSTVWVLADVYEHELGRVKVGQTAALELPSYPGETFTGKLTFVYPSLDPVTRTLRVRLELANPGLRLKPGMYGNVRIRLAHEEALVVPSEAVVDTGERQYVFVALPDGRFEPRPVVVGARSAGKAEILRGLAEGETVVTTGNFLLDSESRLQGSLAPPGHEGHAP